jgi:hypothetical protein
MLFKYQGIFPAPIILRPDLHLDITHISVQSDGSFIGDADAQAHHPWGKLPFTFFQQSLCYPPAAVFLQYTQRDDPSGLPVIA